MKVVTKTQQFANAAILEVEVGTTGLRGGDTGHGGRTFLRFTDKAGTDMRIKSSEGEVLLVFGGDAELENLILALQFALDVLNESKESGTSADMPTVGSRTVD
jgi:hypothetical protein